jgi:hypothetical protein
MKRLENRDEKNVISEFITKKLIYIEKQTLTKGCPLERMKDGWNRMMKCVNCDLIMLLGKYLS